MNNQTLKGDRINVAAPAGGVVSGKLYMIGAFLFGVAANTVAAGVQVALWLVGVYSLAKVSAQAWALGDAIYLNTQTGLCTNLPQIATVAATASFAQGATAITMTANPGTVAAGMQVYDTTAGAWIGTVASYVTTALVLAGSGAVKASAGSTDSLIFYAPKVGVAVAAAGNPSGTGQVRLNAAF
jgi:predicted RecA/RadA family phage recombinase